MTETTSTKPATSTRVQAGHYHVKCGTHAFLVARDTSSWWFIEGLDNRTDEMIRSHVYHGTAYAAASELLRDARVYGAPTLKAAVAEIERVCNA